MDNQEEYIRDYFNEILEADEQAAFERRYAQDAAFRSLADQIESEVKGIRNEARANLKRQFSQWEAEVNKTQPVRWIWTGVAASLLLLVAAWLYYGGGKTNKELFMAYYEPQANYERTTTRNTDMDSLTIRDRAFQAYDQGYYQLAHQLFSQTINQDSLDMPVYFFRAIANIQLERYDQSLIDFNKVVISNNAYYATDAKWYLALLKVKLDQRTEAKDLLLDLAQTTKYQGRAEAILEEL